MLIVNVYEIGLLGATNFAVGTNEKCNAQPGANATGVAGACAAGAGGLFCRSVYCPREVSACSTALGVVLALSFLEEGVEKEDRFATTMASISTAAAAAISRRRFMAFITA